MRHALLLQVCMLLLSVAAMGQHTDTFAVKKQVVTPAKLGRDTFIQRTYLSEKTEMFNRILYRTGIKITGPGTLVLFKATQSILNATGVSEDRNANMGEFYKLPCSMSADSIFFIFTQRRQSGRAPGKTLEITKGYRGVFVNGAIWMEINTTSNSSEVLPAHDEERFVLFKEEMKVTNRK